MEKFTEILIFTGLVGKDICFEEMDTIWLNMGLCLVQNSETGVKVEKSLKIIFFDIFHVFVDKFCINVPINNGTQYLITRNSHKPNIGWNNMEKIDLDVGKKIHKMKLQDSLISCISRTA